MPASTDVNPSAKGGLAASHLIDEIERRLAEPPDLATRLEEPNLPAAREAAGRIVDVAGFVGSRLLRIGEIEAGPELEPSALACRALLRNYGTLRALRQRRTWAAADHLVASLLAEIRVPTNAQTSLFDAVSAELSRRRKQHPHDAGDESESPEWLVLFSQAAEEVISRSVAEGETRSALRSLTTHLDLGQDDLGRLFGVSGETVRRWERGRVRIPSERGAAILAAESALRRLLEVFRPERLPLVVRRKADLFAGDTALEWILRGRIDDVVERYDRTFRYQV